MVKTITHPTCCLPDGERHIAFARNLLRRTARGFFVGPAAVRVDGDDEEEGEEKADG